MSIGERIMRESERRLRYLRKRPERVLISALHRGFHWGAMLNYFLSAIVLTIGISAGWRFAEIGFDLMMNNVSSQEVQEKVIKKIPAWIFVYKGMKLW